MKKIIYILFLIIAGHKISAQPWTYNFGTGTGVYSTNNSASTAFLPAPSSGSDRVRVSNGQGGSFNMENAGLSALGTNTELRIVGPTGGSCNKFSIYDYTPAKTGYLKFSMLLGNSAGGNSISNGEFYLFIGDGAQYSDNNTFAGAQTFTGIQFQVASGGTITTKYRNGSSWSAMPAISPVPLTQANVYSFEIYFNNSTSSQNYDRSGSYSIAANKQDIWINGVLVGDDLSKAQLGNNVNIDSWMFYGINCLLNNVNIFIDDCEYSNSLPVAACTAPTTQASGITFGTITNSQIPVSWSGNGNGDGVIVVAKAGTSVNNPVDGTDYTANAAFGTAGSQIGSTGSYVVYKGTGSNVTVTGLSACTEYTFKVFAYKCSGTSIVYQTSNATNNPETQYTINRPNQAQNILFQNITATAVDVKWTAPSGGCNGYVVKYGTNNTFTDISDAVALPSGGNAPWTDEEIVFTNSSSTGFTITGLTPTTTHYFKVYSYRLCNGTYYFNNTETTNNKSSETTLASSTKPAGVCPGEVIKIPVPISDVSNPTYQWKVYNTGTGAWDNLSNGTPYAGVTTDTLTIDPASTSLNGNQYLCEIGNSLHACNSVSSAITISVFGLPETPVINDTTNNCGNTVLTRGTPPGTDTWYWQGTNSSGTSTTNSSATYTTSSDDTYYLRAQNTDGCWSVSSDSQTVVIKQIPVASISSTAGCGLGSVRVSSSLSGDQTFDLRDNSGNPLSPTKVEEDNAAFYDFESIESGTYKAYVIKDGCSSLLSGSTTLTNFAIPDVPTMNDSSVCGNNLTITMVATPNGIGTTAIEFSVDGTPPADDTDASSPYTYNVLNVMQGAPRTIYARSSNGSCQSEWITAMAIANYVPGLPSAITGVSSPVCQQYDTSVYSTTSDNASTYSWFINGATEGNDFSFLGTKNTASEAVAWDSSFSGNVSIGVIANNVCGSSDTTFASLSITQSTRIDTQPTNQKGCSGSDLSISLAASGTGAITFQWQKRNSGAWDDISDGATISGTNTNTITFSPSSLLDADKYRCIVQSSCGTNAISGEATLDVLKIPDTEAIKNLINNK